MKRINDIFYSLQGEGRNTGRAAIFIRFAGCNLRCSFCDTQFNEYREMTDEQILNEIAQYPSRFVVLTGGEPALQVDEPFVQLLHAHGYEIAMESNGTKQPPKGIDWLTCSPKGKVAISHCNELKCILMAMPATLPPMALRLNIIICSLAMWAMRNAMPTLRRPA